MLQPESKPRLETPRAWLWQVFCGMCMGAADLVPGISGGTIAFIMGIYQGLISSLKSLNPKTLKLLLTCQFRPFFNTVAWEFMLALITGASLSFLLFAEAFDRILNDETYRVCLYAAFMGLILASAVFCAKQVKQWQMSCYAALFIGGVFAFILTGSDLTAPALEDGYRIHLPLEKVANPSKKELLNYREDIEVLSGVSEKTLTAMLAKGTIIPSTPVYDEQSKEKGTVVDFVTNLYTHSKINVWMIICGAIAICAMLLPGISGSYLLTILGAYPMVIGALADFVRSLKQFSFDTDAFFTLFSLALGIVIGAVGFARVLSWLLKHYHDLSIALLTGFMLGALRSVWPYWTYAYELLPLRLEKGPQILVVEPLMPNLDLSTTWVSFAFILAGFATVFVVEALAGVVSSQKSEVRSQ